MPPAHAAPVQGSGSHAPSPRIPSAPSCAPSPGQEPRAHPEGANLCQQPRHARVRIGCGIQVAVPGTCRRRTAGGEDGCGTATPTRRPLVQAARAVLRRQFVRYCGTLSQAEATGWRAHKHARATGHRRGQGAGAPPAYAASPARAAASAGPLLERAPRASSARQLRRRGGLRGSCGASPAVGARARGLPCAPHRTPLTQVLHPQRHQAAVHSIAAQRAAAQRVHKLDDLQ
jgi:hypothetical protein